MFICGGTFVGLDKIISKRLGQRTIGFGQKSGHKVELSQAELLQHATSDDLTDFGLIPELVGRLPVIAPLGPLEEESLVRVLTEPKNALVRQYQQLFAMENAELHFTDEALRAVAHKAIKKQTGARGLRSIIEGMMLEIMFDLPDHGNGQRYVITEDVVEGRAKLFPLQDTKNKSA